MPELLTSVAVDLDKTGATRFKFTIPVGRSPIPIICGLKEFCTATVEVNGSAVVVFGREMDAIKTAELVSLCQ